MRFLEALKKSDNRKSELKAPQGEIAPPGQGKFGHLVPGLVGDPSIKIGRDSQSFEFPPGSSDSAGCSDGNGAINPAALDHPNVKSFPTILIDETRVNRHFVAITDPKSAFCEEYRNLRATLLQRNKKQKLKTISIVSVVPAEGKSITALNLAWLIAQTDGMRALVIDGDLRLPSLTKYLGVESEIGLSDVLNGDARLEDAIVCLKPSGLHLMPGGQSGNEIAEQFSGPTFARLLDQLQETFDFIIIDAPPLSVFTDAKVLMNQTDGSILVVRSNYTKFKDIDRVLEGLPRQRILGVVLNRSEETLIRGKYYDYSYYQNYRK